MKCFDIFDKENQVSVGTLLYYEQEKVFITELTEGLDEWTAPLMFTAFVKKGIFTIPRDISLAWVRERLIPPNRQNIGSILKTHKLKEYDEIRFLEISEGNCSQDSLIIKKTEQLPEYVKQRMTKNLTDLLISDDSVLAFFADDTVRKINLEKLVYIDGAEKLKNNRSLFESGRIGAGGYYATFNNSIDIPAAKLYNAGISLPLTKTDFINFVQKNVFDTTEACKYLDCSRQNMAYLVGRGVLSPIKTDVKGSLYLKSDVLTLF